MRLRKTARLIRPPEPLTITQWAERERVLPAGATSRPGRFRALCYQREPMDAVLEQDVAVSVWMVASQMFKTEAINSVLGYHVAHDPCAQMVMYPTLESAEEWSKKKFEPSIRATPALSRRVRMTSRDAGNTIRSKSYAGGHLTAVGANSPSGLRQRSARVVIGDEIDACEESAGEEGDPVELLFRRAETFPDAIKILSSTPTIRGRSRIEGWFQKSDQRRWFAVCPHCQAEQNLKWSGVQWDEGKPETARYACEAPGCGVQWGDADRIRAIEAGQWRATAPFQGIRGYHLSGIYSLLPASRGYVSRLHQMAAEFLRAKHSTNARQAMRVWKNTFLAETDEEHEGDTLPPSEIYERREHYLPSLPNKALLLTAAVDVQINRLELEITAWGVGEESWGVEKLVIPGHPRSAKTWANLDAARTRTWTREDGTQMRVAITCVDAGKWPEFVAAYVIPRQGQRVYAVKGSGQNAAPLVAPARKVGIRRLRLFLVGTNTAKATLYARLAQGLEGDGVCHFPRGAGGEEIAGYDEEHFKQLVIERMGTKFERGQPITVFWKMDGERNEALDLRVYGMAGLAILNPGWAELARRLAVREPLPPVEPVPEAPKPTSRPAGARRGGFVGSWR